MIGARLESLPADHRRLLRAASVMGESFLPDALRRLVGQSDGSITGALATLVGPVFDRIAGSLVDAFVKRAEQVYG